MIIIAGLLVTTLAGPAWGRYSGLLIAGFGLGPTVPICMTWSAELFGPRHGEVGVASASAIVSGLGNLGSVTTVILSKGVDLTVRLTHFILGGRRMLDIARVTLSQWEWSESVSSPQVYKSPSSI